MLPKLFRGMIHGFLNVQVRTFICAVNIAIKATTPQLPTAFSYKMLLKFVHVISQWRVYNTHTDVVN